VADRGRTRHPDDAARFLIGGVNSPVRAFRQVDGQPLILTAAKGAGVRDASGRAYLDFIMGWGALILGHNHPDVVSALRQATARGVMYGLTHPAEFELARLISNAVPSVEQVRFTVSGTEACMTAVRLARAHTGRAKIVVFDGGYHGHSDSLMAGATAGVPEAIAQQTLRLPYGEAAALEAALRRYGTELAAVILEPVAANMGVVTPPGGFLARVRDLTTHHGILLIFDEVVTGFRVGLGGAQGYFGITPDLTVFGKIIGGGLPIGAVGGPRRLMQRLAPEGDVYHGGTFAGHPLSMAAGIATLRRLTAQPPYEPLDGLAATLVEGLVKSAARHDAPIVINRIGSMLTLFFSEGPVENLAQAQATQRDRFAHWARTLRQQGVVVPPSPFEALFLSTAHTKAHVARFLEASHVAFRAPARRRR
jgi:glutamate-1-semialdehyde 2,1-aminomutase